MRIGTPLSDTAVRVMLLGAGELGKEVAIELQRLGAEVVAVDRYPNAPAMQVAHRSHVIPMTDPQVLNGVIMAEAPHIIVPEIEAIATDVLAAIEAAGMATIIPTARATQLTMNREGIRRLAAEDLVLLEQPKATLASPLLSKNEYRRANWTKPDWMHLNDAYGKIVIRELLSSFQPSLADQSAGDSSGSFLRLADPILGALRSRLSQLSTRRNSKN